MVANTLIRKELISYIVALSEVISGFNEGIKQIVYLDTSHEKLRQ